MLAARGQRRKDQERRLLHRPPGHVAQYMQFNCLWSSRCAERTRARVLEGRAKRGDQLFAGGEGERVEGENVTRQTEPQELRGEQRGAELRAITPAPPVY